MYSFCIGAPRRIGGLDHRPAARARTSTTITSTRATCPTDLHPVEGPAVGRTARGRHCAACVSASCDLGLTFLVVLMILGLGYEWTHYLIHSDYKPKTRLYQGDLAKPPATPLQERALLVHRDQLRHRRPGARHVSRSRVDRDVADSQEPVRDGGLADAGRFGAPGPADGRNPVPQSENERRQQADVDGDDDHPDRVGVQEIVGRAPAGLC